MCAQTFNYLLKQFTPSVRRADYFFTTNRHKLAGKIAHEFRFMGSEISHILEKANSRWSFHALGKIEFNHIRVA